MKKSSILEARRKLVNPEVQKKVDFAFQIIDRNHEILVEKELKQKDADSVPSTELWLPGWTLHRLPDDESQRPVSNIFLTGFA